MCHPVFKSRPSPCCWSGSMHSVRGRLKTAVMCWRPTAKPLNWYRLSSDPSAEMPITKLLVARRASLDVDSESEEAIEQGCLAVQAALNLAIAPFHPEFEQTEPQ